MNRKELTRLVESIVRKNIRKYRSINERVNSDIDETELTEYILDVLHTKELSIVSNNNNHI